MNFNFAEKINPSLEKFDFIKAIQVAETALAKIPTTDFHAITGESLLHHVEDLAFWIEEFYQSVSAGMPVKALYFEMNEFDINTDLWYIDGFAYEEDGGLDPVDMEWLADVSSDAITEDQYALTGYEQLQEAFENAEFGVEDTQKARDWCEQLVITRFMELMRTTHLKAKEIKLGWAALPIYYTEHAYDFIVRSTT